MGLTNFTPPPSGNNSGGGPSLPPFPPMGGMSGHVDDVTSMLIDYNERFKNATQAMHRDELIAQAISVLIGKQKPNPLLVGPAGVGKTRIVEEIARRIAAGDPLIPKQLSKDTIYELPLSNLVAGAGVVGELEERLTALVDFATEPKNHAIIFIDEIHQLLESRDPILKKVAQILKPALARGGMRVIGATTMNEATSFDNDPAFQRRFTRLIVDELTREQTAEVLFNALPSYLKHYDYKVTVSPDVLRKLVVIADENSRANSHRPDSALTLLDRAMADTVVSHSTAIASALASGQTAAASAMQAMPSIPLGESKLRSVAVRLMTGLAKKEAFDEARTRAQLDRIKGQAEIIDEVLDAVRRDELAVFPRKKPMAWLFAGPSGVGKTEVTKIIARELTGQEPIMLNMGEHAHEHDISRIIGAGPGYVGSDSNKELPFDTLESNPYRVILLDELEKAHNTMHRLFLTALDEGWMRMASGKIIDFSKTIIIATTNAGRDQIGRAPVGFQSESASKRMTAQELTKTLQGDFEPEFLGRFSKIIAFSPLARETYAEILVASYERERVRIVTNDPKLATALPRTIEPTTLARLVETTYLADQGARPAEGAARQLIEDSILAAVAPAPLAAATTAPFATATAPAGAGDVATAPEALAGTTV